MDVDWGGQGPASMPTGSTCGDLGTDKCAQITGSGSSTSTMGVAGMGTTFIQTVDVQNLNMADRGGRVNYTIKVHKQDDADSIYMHITGRDGTIQHILLLPLRLIIGLCQQMLKLSHLVL